MSDFFMTPFANLPRLGRFSRFARGGVLLAVALGATLRAQDLTVLNPRWLHEDVGNPAPRGFSRPPRVEVPAGLREYPEVGYVTLLEMVDPPEGLRPLTEQVQASHADLRSLVALPDLRPPRAQKGQDKSAVRWHAVVFNPASASTGGSDASPRLLDVRPILVPWDQVTRFEATHDNPIWATMTVSATGAWSELVLPEAAEVFRPVIESSLAEWRFAPARSAGRAVSASLRLPLVLQRYPHFDRRTQTTLPLRIRSVPALHPDYLRAQGLTGEVVVEALVGADGRTGEVQVRWSTHKGFHEAAVEAVRRWIFEPAYRGGQPIEARLTLPIVFTLDTSENMFQASPGFDRKRPNPDPLPSWLRRELMRVAYPYEALKTRQRGRATVEVARGAHGEFVSLRLVEASSEEFGLALVAWLERSVWPTPPGKRKRGMEPLLVEHRFDFDDQFVRSRDDHDLWRLEDEGSDRIVKPAALDQPLRPALRAAPVFPVLLRERLKEGSAVVECLIDEDGGVRLPRVYSATAPEFGFAAVQAAADWQFHRPTAGGKPAVVRVRLPFRFAWSDEPAHAAPTRPPE